MAVFRVEKNKGYTVMSNPIIKILLRNLISLCFLVNFYELM